MTLCKKTLLWSGLFWALDQATKIYIKLHYPLGYTIVWIDPWLKFHFVENPGAAFGLSLSGLFSTPEGDEGALPKVLLTLLSLFITAGIGYYLVQLTKEEPRLQWPTSLILGGAVGNLTDRIFYGVLFAGRNLYEGGWLQGHVVDFIYLDLWQGLVPSWVPFWGGEYMALWPIFNLADSYISLGVIWLLLLQLKRPRSS